MDADTIDSTSVSSWSTLQEPPDLEQIMCISVGFLLVLAIICLFLRYVSSYPLSPPMQSNDDRDWHTSAGTTRPVKARKFDRDLEAAAHIPVSILGLSDFGGEICAICLGEFVCGEAVKILPRCKHMFHDDCIDAWLPIRSLNCPVCRDRIIDDEQDVEIKR
ncbi:RING-H2 finger protein ATL79-like [Sesamum indicum]|uniref:RING-type E3 ubiquitin transferase n=1 Tax=Sesamum indicum TaxID=4182 RepID=A0A6I9U6H2_SESIN|nr:RING-H2 finger protein ATL79-like [Sesamum indicum]